MTVYEFAILLAATGLVLAVLAWDLHRLPVRLLAREAQRFADQTVIDLAFTTITQHYDEEPTP